MPGSKSCCSETLERSSDNGYLRKQVWFPARHGSKLGLYETTVKISSALAFFFFFKMSRNTDFRKAYQNKQFIVNAQWGWRALCLKKESSFHGVVLDSHDLFCRFWTLGRMAWSALSECTCVTPLLATFCLCADSDQIPNFNSDGDLRFATGLPA